MAGNCENLATKAELNKLRQELLAEMSRYATNDALVRGDNETRNIAQNLFNLLLPMIAGLKNLLFDFVKRPEFQNFKISTNQQLSNLKHTLDNLKEDIAALEQRIEKLNGKIEDIFSRLNTLDTKINNFRSQLEEKIASNFGLIQALDGKVQTVQTKISVIESDIKKLKGLEDRVSSNESNIKTLDGNVKKALDLINKTRQELNDTNRAVEKAFERANKALERADNAQNTADFALNAATEAQGRANDALSKANSNESRIGKLDSKIGKIDSRVDKFESRIDLIDTRVTDLKQESRDEDKKLAKRIKALENKIANLKLPTPTPNNTSVDKIARARANLANSRALKALDRTTTNRNLILQNTTLINNLGQRVTLVTQNITNNITNQVTTMVDLKPVLKLQKDTLTLAQKNTVELTQIKTQVQPEKLKQATKTGICESTQGGCLSNALNPILDGIGDLLNNQCPDLSLPDISGSLTVDCNGETLSFPYSGNGILGLESLINALSQAQNACPDNQEQPQLVLAIPESWGQLVEANRPQLNVVYFYQDPEFPDKRSFWNLSIPHYKLSEVNTTKQLFPSYRKGNKMGVATLSDNSKIIVNGFDESNVNRVLDVLQMLVSKPVVDRRISHTNRQLSTEFVIPYKASFYPNGRQDAYTKKKLQPEWEKLFEEI